MLAIGYIHVVGVLAVFRGGRLDVAAIELVVQDFLGVLLGFLRGVGVVEVGLVAADDVAWVGHGDRGGGCIEFLWYWKGRCGGSLVD